MEQGIDNKLGHEARCISFFFPKSGGVGIFYSTYDFKIQEEIKVENTGNVYALSMSIVKRRLSPF